MKLFPGRARIRLGFPLRRPRKAGVIGLALAAIGAPMLLFLIWPYATLWRIDQAVRSGDTAALDRFVDLESVRAQIKQKLNKDASSTIGPLSNAFIRWLEEGIGIMGNEAIERLVTLSWVRARLREHSTGDGDKGFWGQLTYAFFDAPDELLVRIGPALDTPVQLRLSLRNLQWRISAVYY